MGHAEDRLPARPAKVGVLRARPAATGARHTPFRVAVTGRRPRLVGSVGVWKFRHLWRPVTPLPFPSVAGSLSATPLSRSLVAGRVLAVAGGRSVDVTGAFRRRDEKLAGRGMNRGACVGVCARKNSAFVRRGGRFLSADCPENDSQGSSQERLSETTADEHFTVDMPMPPRRLLCACGKHTDPPSIGPAEGIDVQRGLYPVSA